MSKDVVNFFNVSISARARGQLSPAKNKKITFSDKKLTELGQKQITRILFVYNIFRMIIFFILELNVIDVSSLS